MNTVVYLGAGFYSYSGAGAGKSYKTGFWNVANSGTLSHRILDEFDVFMDAVNRRVCLMNIINYARETRKNQYILLTPLNTSNIAVGEDIKIIKLSKLQSN